MVEIPDRVALAAGVVAPATILATFGIGAASTPGYAWPTDPFSSIGATAGVAASLFNAGLVLAGAVSLPFAARLWRSYDRAVGGLYAVVGCSFVGAGVFPAGESTIAHDLFGSVAFLGIWILLWAAGVVDWRRGDRRTALAAVALGSVALLVWLPYDLGVRWAQVGYGAAEVASVLALGLWSAGTTVRLWARSSHRTANGRREVAP